MADDLDVTTVSATEVLRMFDACETPRELLCIGGRRVPRPTASSRAGCFLQVSLVSAEQQRVAPHRTSHSSSYSPPRAPPMPDR